MQALDKKICKAARALLDWKAADLADAAGISHDTLRSFESGRTKALSRENEEAIRQALEANGVHLLEGGQEAAGPGVSMAATERSATP